MRDKIYEKIVTEINPDVENPQLSERSIRETLDTIVPDDISDDGVDEFVNKYIPLFKTMAGNVRKDVSDFVKKAKPKEEPKDVDDDKGDDAPKETEPKEGEGENPLDIIVDKLTALEKRLNEQEGKVSVARSKVELQADASKIYPDSVVRAASMDFDFSIDDAKDAFFNKLSEVAKLFNVKPEGGKADTEFDSESFLKRNRERSKYS